jgi:hypothetical protein
VPSPRHFLSIDHVEPPHSSQSPSRRPRTIPKHGQHVPDLYRAFFLGNSTRKDLLPRSGYYVGFLIARELGQSHSLQQLAQMNGELLRSTVRRMLQKMAL